jgi:signal transduction histidine kinase
MSWMTGGPTMHEDRRKTRKRERKQERRRRREEAEEDEYREQQDALDEVLLSPEERALAQARREAERKVEITGDMLRFGAIALALLVFLPPVGVIFLIFAGRDHIKNLYRMLLEPRLREKFMREQVEHKVHAHLSHERQTLEGQHARSMQELSASIAHEIRNPITAAKSLVQQMGEEPAAHENTEYAKVALEELDRVERSVSHLLRFAREEELRPTVVPLSDIVESALETFRDRIGRSRVELARRFEAEGMLRGDPEKLRRIVINLVGNAIDALEESDTEKPRIEVQVGENLAGSEVWLRVADNGPGIDREVLDKMWSPFYTRKANGTGLGLSICKKLVDAHGGTIEAGVDPSGGAEFLLTFPKTRSLDGGVQ